MKTQKYYDKLYKKVNDILSFSTPLHKDCGKLCGKKCCKGDEETGMLLFPFEKTTLAVKEENGVRVAVCSGTCNREERPLSCRIFPFFPYINAEGKIEVKRDLRGLSVCPLVAISDEVKWNRGFLFRVKRVGQLLKKDEAIFDFLKKQSEEIDTIADFVE